MYTYIPRTRHHEGEAVQAVVRPLRHGQAAGVERPCFVGIFGG